MYGSSFIFLFLPNHYPPPLSQNSPVLIMSYYLLVPVYLENLICPLISQMILTPGSLSTLSNITPVLTLRDVNDNVSDASDNLAFFLLSHIIIINCHGHILDRVMTNNGKPSIITISIILTITLHVSNSLTLSYTQLCAHLGQFTSAPATLHLSCP